MDRILMRSKLHRLTVTETNIDYEGSITIDKKLLAAADIVVGEKVQIINISNALRFETYAIEGKSGEACLNGGAARLAAPGDKIIVISYGIFSDSETKTYKPKVILVDGNNALKKG
ncbi:aspartate 1-decarboxylase [Candidatus Margulisiibacteriota bacterium]